MKAARTLTSVEDFSTESSVSSGEDAKPQRRRRSPRARGSRYTPIAIRLHPDVITWARTEGEKRGIGYQTVINEVLLELTRSEAAASSAE